MIDTRGTPGEISAGPRGKYWIADSKVLFGSSSGTSARVLADVLGEDASTVVADTNAVYFSASGRGRVMKLPIDGGTPKPIAVDLGEVHGLALHDGWVYVAATEKGQILRISQDGSAAEPTGRIDGPCPKPIGTPEEIAATPRWNGALELMALSLEPGRLTASDEMYARLVADVDAIGAMLSTGFGLSGAVAGGRNLTLSPDALTTERIRRNEYSAWDCLNEFYGLESLELSDFKLIDETVRVRLKGIYNMPTIAALYAQLPGIKSARADSYGGDGSRICTSRDGSTFTYVFDERGGDCPAGCTEHNAHAFRSTAPGQVEAIGAWNDHDRSKLTPPPDWYSICAR